MKVKTACTSCEYITAGKVYDAPEDDDREYFFLVDDEGDTIFCALHECAHLDGEGWIIVEGDK